MAMRALSRQTNAWMTASQSAFTLMTTAAAIWQWLYGSWPWLCSGGAVFTWAVLAWVAWLWWRDEKLEVDRAAHTD